MTDLNETLNNLKKMYLKKLENDLPSMKIFLEETLDYDKLMQIRDIVHKISGTGGMYGLKCLSEACCNFEMYLNQIRDNKILVDEKIVKTKLNDIIELAKKTIQEEPCQTS